MDAKKASQPTWETVRYMVSCIQYGGRITDDFDQLLMDTFAEKYFTPPMLTVRTRLSRPVVLARVSGQGGPHALVVPVALTV